MSQLNNIATLLQEYPDGKVLFDEPIKVQAQDHHMFTIYGAWVDVERVWLMDGSGKWHGPLEESQQNATHIIGDLNDRLKEMLSVRA